MAPREPFTTIGEAQRTLARAFAAAGLETPALDARLLVAGALGLDAAAPLREPERRLTAVEMTQVRRFADRRLAREPVSRILGRRAFHGLDLEIGPATLDPRPETETLVEAVLGLVAGGETPGGRAPRILDLGTGSGAIAIALLMALPEANGVGTDISEAALAVARRNAARAGVEGRLALLTSSWLDDVEGPFDLVVSNPPYIASATIAGLAPEVRLHDPTEALDGGPDGLDAYRAILAGIGRVLLPGGWIAFEIGEGQAEALTALCEAREQLAQPLEMRHWCDLAGRIRCVAIKARH